MEARGEVKEGRKQEDEAFAQEETHILPWVNVRTRACEQARKKYQQLYEYANKK